MRDVKSYSARHCIPLPELDWPQLDILSLLDFDERSKVGLRAEKVGVGRQTYRPFSEYYGRRVVKKTPRERQPVAAEHALQVFTVRRHSTYRATCSLSILKSVYIFLKIANTLKRRIGPDAAVIYEFGISIDYRPSRYNSLILHSRGHDINQPPHP